MTSTYLYAQCPAKLGLLNRLGQILASLVPQWPALWSYRETKTQATLSQQVSILFTDIAGFSYLMTVWPLEMVVSSLNCYFKGLSQYVYSHKGQVDKFMGDGMMAVFEAPDDAVRAAQAIKWEVVRFNSAQTEQGQCSFPTRIVVDTGLVVRTALGLHRDRDWAVMGPVVNTASHMVQISPPDRIFISHGTYSQLMKRSSLHLAEPQVMNVHGGKLTVYEVTA
jgi:adenylate cyclase